MVHILDSFQLDLLLITLFHHALVFNKRTDDKYLKLIRELNPKNILQSIHCEGPPPGPLRRRVPPITVGPHPGSQYLAPALALGSPVLAPQGRPTSGYLVKSPLTISIASVRVRSCELRRYNHPRHTLTTN